MTDIHALSALRLTLRVGVMHVEQRHEGGVDCFYATETQAAVLNFRTKQLSNDRVARGAQRTATETQITVSETRRKTLHL